MRFAIALIVATIAISFSDWLFFGLIFHDRYMTTPDVWRPTPEGRKIAGSMVMAFLGTAAFLVLAEFTDARGAEQAFVLATLAWLAAALPQTITNTIYVKYDRVLAVSHSLGWLARLIIAAAAYVWIVR